MHKWFSTEKQGHSGCHPAAHAGLRIAALGAFLLAGLCAPMSANAAPAGCAALQAKYPQFKGKTLVDAVNPHTPGYEALDPRTQVNTSASTSTWCRPSVNVSVLK